MAAKQPRRKPIPPEIEKEILTKGRRRCPLCFHLDKDTRQKKGQIAHLDRRRSNNIEDNLAFLCLDHHSEYDSKTSQHKNHTIEEVKEYRKALYKWVRRGMPTIEGGSKPASKSRNGVRRRTITPKQAVTAPEIVVEYVYADNNRENHDANRPLVVRNISKTAAAYNVEVLPLVTDHGTAEFEPSLIPSIEAGGAHNVFALIKGGSPLFSRRRLPGLLHKSYADESFEELFEVKKFALRVRFQGIERNTIFETESELLFTPYKQKTTIGKIRRKIVRPREGSRSVSAPNRLPERRPKVTPTSYDETPDRYERLHLSNEGTPAYEVQIEPISLNDGWSVVFEPINRLAGNGFSNSFVSRDDDSSLCLWGLWPEGNQQLFCRS